MKIGIITDEVTQDIIRAVGFAKRHRLDGIELRSIDNMNIDLVPLNRIMEIKKIIESSGLEVCNISSSFFKCSIDSRQEYDDNIEKLKRLAEIAHILNCKSIRGFSFFANGNFDAGIEKIVEKFQKPLEYISRENIYLLLESDPSVFTTNCSKLSKLLSTLDSKYIGAIYDPGNDIYDPEFERPFPEGFEKIKKYIMHVHVKDAVLKNGKPESVKLGTGSVPYPEIIDALSCEGYTGYMALETHYRKSGNIPEELLKRPGGNLFSDGGEEASEESMVELKRLLHHI